VTTADRPPLVRPRFLKWSAVAFALLVPFVIHAVWDYAEMWRLAASIARIHENHEPLTSQEIEPSRTLTGEAASAARYYRAAAALAGSEFDEERLTGIRARVSSALWSDIWPGELLADLRSRVARDDDAFRLMDRATPLPFEGFGLGTNINARIAEMLTLMRVAALRTRLLALDGDGNGAAASLYAELRLQRTLDYDPSPSGISGFTAAPWSSGSARLGDSLRLIANRSHPDAAALSRIASRLREMDRDDVVKRHLIRARAAIFDNGALYGTSMLNMATVRDLGFWDSVRRPWLLKLLNERIETLGALIAGSNRPWPARMDPPSTAYLSDTATERLSRQIDAGQIAGTAADLALIRCARVVVAVEQYRLEHGQALPPRGDDLVPLHLDAIPIDPFSGKPLRLVAEERGYVVYSLGLNRRDDHGRLLTREMLGRRFPESPPPAADLGIRISHR
jgi:hypothetical protein